MNKIEAYQTFHTCILWMHKASSCSKSIVSYYCKVEHAERVLPFCKQMQRSIDVWCDIFNVSPIYKSMLMKVWYLEASKEYINNNFWTACCFFNYGMSFSNTSPLRFLELTLLDFFMLCMRMCIWRIPRCFRSFDTTLLKQVSEFHVKCTEMKLVYVHCIRVKGNWTPKMKVSRKNYMIISISNTF